MIDTVQVSALTHTAVLVLPALVFLSVAVAMENRVATLLSLTFAALVLFV